MLSNNESERTSSAGRVRPDVSNEVAWQEMHDSVKRSPHAQQILLKMLRTEAGRKQLEYARAKWHRVGLSAPFEFVFEDEQKVGVEIEK